MDDYEAWRAERRADVDRYVKWTSFLWPMVLLFAAAATLAMLLAVLVGESDTDYGTLAAVSMLGALAVGVLLTVMQRERHHVERLLTDERHHRERVAHDETP